MSISVSIAAIIKKILEVLASDKNGRKFLGYVLGIAIFIVLIPLITLFGLFGYTYGGAVAEFNPNDIIEQLPDEYREQITQYDSVLSEIETVFAEYSISSDDIFKAEIIYISCLVGKENESDTFYIDYAMCFVNQNEQTSVYDNITSVFGVEFSDEDIRNFNNIAGGIT